MKFRPAAIFISFLMLHPASRQLYAQSTACGIPGFPFACNVNLVNPVFRDQDIVAVTGVRYSAVDKLTDIEYKNDDPVFDDCGAAFPFKCNKDVSLVYDVYYPNNLTVYPCYKDKPLPAVILFHGGGFSDCSDYTGEKGIKLYCQEFAKRGFVAFNVEYRRGRLKDTAIAEDGGTFLSGSNVLATYRAFQDGRGAIRSIIAEQNGPGKPPYRIDEENIFIGGVSSGAFIAMSMAYYNGDMINELFADVKAVLGPVDFDGYVGKPQQKFKIKGVLNLWGGGYIPAVYQSAPEMFFRQNKNNNGKLVSPPMISFQGGQDITVPVKKANIYFSQNRFFKRATVCTDLASQPYIVPDNDQDGLKKDMVLYGTQGFYDVLKKGLGISVESYIDSDMRHGLGNNSDFGTTLNQNGDGTSVIPYIVQRAAVYFQSIATGVHEKLITSVFEDCENFRKGCIAKDNNEGCINNGRQETVSVDSRKVLNAESPSLFSMRQANKMLYLNFSAGSPAEIAIFDPYGNLRLRVVNRQSRQQVINCQQLPMGTYIIRVTNGTAVQSVKFNL